MATRCVTNRRRSASQRRRTWRLEKRRSRLESCTLEGSASRDKCHVRRGALARTTVKAGRRLARLVQGTVRFPFKLFVILSQCRAAACQHWPAHARCETRSYMYTLRGREGIFLQLSRTSRPALPYRIAVYSCAINHQTWLPRAGERQSSCLSLTPTSTQRHYRQKHS